MKHAFLALACLGVLACGAASAQQTVTMVGTWKGQATAVHVGANPYRGTQQDGPNFSPNVLEFTFVITDQQGNRFAGTVTAGTRSETIIGAISPDSRSGIMVDDDGQYILTVKDAETVDACYFHSVATGKVAACYTLKRAQ